MCIRDRSKSHYIFERRNLYLEFPIFLKPYHIAILVLYLTVRSEKIPEYVAAEVLDIISCYSKISHRAFLLYNTTMSFWISLLPKNPHYLHRITFINRVLANHFTVVACTF